MRYECIKHLAESAIKYQNIFNFIVLLIVFSFIIWFSIWQGKYILDPHHWGLMLSNAKDLVDGKTPYKDIFIQYGILTTLIHGFAFRFLGHNLQSVIFITSIFYAVGLIGIYHLSVRLSGSRQIGLYSFLSSAIIHPLCIYPWPNYIAFPFLVFGALALIGKKDKDAIAAGALMSLSILSRESFFAPIVVFVVVATLVIVATRIKIRERRYLALLWLAFCVPLVAFFAYLLAYGLIPYWYKTSVLLPQIYAETFFPDGFTQTVLQLPQYFIVNGLIQQRIRIVFYGLIVLAAIWTCVSVVLDRSGFRRRWDLFLVSVLTLLCLTSALHIPEIFRLATGVSVGMVLFYYITRQYGLHSISFVFFAALFISSSATPPFNENYYLPTKEQVASSVSRSDVPLFIGQRWRPEVFDFYFAFERDMKIIDARKCGIEFHLNQTNDAFFAALSPFKQFQIAPFGTPAEWNALRPDYSVDEKIKHAKDIVIFESMDEAAVKGYEPPLGFVVFSIHKRPKSYSFRSDHYFMVIAPQTC